MECERTENPRVGGSTPSLATIKISKLEPLPSGFSYVATH